jgi:hypothetical protein
MRIFTGDPKAPRQDASAKSAAKPAAKPAAKSAGKSAAKSALPGPTGFGESHATDAPDPGVARFGYDFGRIPVYPDPVVAAAERGTSGYGAPYPFGAQIQSGFGRHDIGQVRAHTGSRAAAAARAIGARAFAYGDQIAFDGAPDLHTAAHEAAHVVQQRAGVQLKDDQGRPGDAFERHADAVADRIVGRQSAEALLDTMNGSRTAAVQRRVVQRKEKTKYGEFDTTKYADLGSPGSETGVDIELTFEPGNNVDAEKIGLTQSVRSELAGAAVAIDPARHKRLVPSGTGAGREIDRHTGSAFANPIYATDVPGAKDKLGDTPMLGHGQWGWHYTDKAGKAQHQTAILKDTPSLGGPSNNSEQVFETAALAAEGKQSGTYMGSVEWGWRIDAAGKFTRLPLKKISDGAPSAGFMAAAEQWNRWTTRGTIKTTPDPTNVYDAAYSVAFTVAKDIEVQVTDTYMHSNEIYNGVTIQSGKEKGKAGRIKTNDMRDTGGGRATIALPIQRVSTVVAPIPRAGADLVSGRDPGSSVLATLATGTTVTIRDENPPWVNIEVEVDTTQAGVTLSSGTTADIAGMVRGYIARDCVR